LLGAFLTQMVLHIPSSPDPTFISRIYTVFFGFDKPGLGEIAEFTLDVHTCEVEVGVSVFCPLLVKKHIP